MTNQANISYFDNVSPVASIINAPVEQDIIYTILPYIDYKKRSEELEVKLKEANHKIQALEIKVAQLSKTSKNSSKKPSSDIINGKASGDDKENEGENDEEKKKRGGQPGHKKNQRKPFKADEIDQFHNYTLEGCPDCGNHLEQREETQPRIIQQIEIVERPIIIHQYSAFGYWCENCQKIHYPKLPKDIVKAGLCSSSLTALVGYMKSVLHASYSNIRKYLRDVVKIKISRGQLRKLIGKVSDALEAPYEELLKEIPFESRLNIDESGHKENGERFWTWCFRAELYVLFKIDKSRGSKVLIEVLGKEFNGIIGCDYFSAYRKYMKDFNVTLQFCIAHIIRDIRFLTSLPDEQTKVFGEKLLNQFRELFKIIREKGDKTHQQIQPLLQAVSDKIISIAVNETPSELDKDGKELKKHACNIAKRFLKHGNAYFQFITTPQIDPTNNIAEQAIRFIVIDRHITQGTRNESGRRDCERLWTVVGTCTIQSRSAYDFIKKAVQAYFKNEQAPSLLHDTS